MPSLQWLNERLLDLATKAHLIPLCCGLRVVATDGSPLQPAVHACHRTRWSADPNQIFFGMSLPGAELMLHASVHPSTFGERAMLIEALEHLGQNDVLVLDRGYPASWLIQFLIECGIRFVIRFVIRCDNDSGWAAVRSFMHSNEMDTHATLSPPSCFDWRPAIHARRRGSDHARSLPLHTTARQRQQLRGKLNRNRQTTPADTPDALNTNLQKAHHHPIRGVAAALPFLRSLA